MNEFDARYIFSLPYRETNSLENLFAALDEIELLERHRLLGLSHIYSMLDFDGSVIGNSGTEEEVAEGDYRRFKDNCLTIQRLGPEDFFVAYSVVTAILATLRHSAFSQTAEDRIAWFQGSVEFVKAKGSPPEIVSRFEQHAQDAVNNAKVDIEQSKQRYDTFCNKVVAKLL